MILHHFVVGCDNLEGKVETEPSFPCCMTPCCVNNVIVITKIIITAQPVYFMMEHVCEFKVR
jgi:hypothetical protein